jgi:hypothetical protein
MHPTVLRLLRVELSLVLLGSVLVQAVLPSLAHDQGRDFPEVAHLATPYTVLAITAIAALQVAMLVLWHLLTLIATSRLATSRGLRCLDAIMGSVALATALTTGTLFHLLVIVGVGGPGVVLAFVGCTAAGSALVAVLWVLRRAQGTRIDEREPAAV